ncbi:ATP-binding cassette domain-containing protein [Helicovermis profundi]|uniref:ATP-binding cassette domain-containing protein n=1 Tax=Helicovermis profundi TaxID=3065157 RepID=A0AAU9EJL1_9FIRM|nr:ATP-binding cassette domain-containing protein [Clostridia bacterium S502]
MKEQYLLKVNNLNKTFKSKGHKIHAVNNVSFALKKGETLAIVGESGSGKSTTGRLILRLLESDSGEVWFKDRNIIDLNKKEMRKLRRQMQIVFQDPYGSLNPRMTVKQLLSEAINNNVKYCKSELNRKLEELIEAIGLNINDLNKFPHQFSGGQRQRIGLGRSIASNPDLIVCDEPVSALDLLIQAQILNLLKDLQEDYGFSYIFISHDLSVVRHMSDRIAIMYQGRIVEIGTCKEIFENAQHPYTRLLLNAVLKIGKHEEKSLTNDSVKLKSASNDVMSKYSSNDGYYKISETHFVVREQVS